MIIIVNIVRGEVREEVKEEVREEKDHSHFLQEVVYKSNSKKH